MRASIIFTVILVCLREQRNYSVFYIEAVAVIMFVFYFLGGRRTNICLGDILKFATGATAEPVLGFVLHPSLEFTESVGFIPTASTCTNTLKLPRPSLEHPLPPEEDLFSLYDYAFSNAYFGLM